MVTLNDALIELVDAGQVEPKEAYMKAVDKTVFVQHAQAARPGRQSSRRATQAQTGRRRAGRGRQRRCAPSIGGARPLAAAWQRSSRK